MPLRSWCLHLQLSFFSWGWDAKMTPQLPHPGRPWSRSLGDRMGGLGNPGLSESRSIQGAKYNSSLKTL